MTTFWKASNTKMIFCGSIFTLILGVFGFAVLVLLSSVLTDATADTSLEFVIVVPRHGARAPLLTYPTDPYKGSEFWPEGKGSLTKIGKQQMYKMGQNLGKRYSDLFKHGYQPSDLKVRSTPIARTMMSVAVLLAAMFPPRGANLWHPTLHWQPIPIFTEYHLDKTELITDTKLCPKFTDEKNKMTNEYFKNYFEKDREFFHYIEKHSGMNITSGFDYISIHDPLINGDIHGYPLPSWTKPIYPEKMGKVAADIYRLTLVATPLMNKLFSGPLLKDFDQWISSKMDGRVREKMLIHGAHDVTIVGILAAVGFEDIPFVDPAATLVIELHRSEIHGHEVRMLYYNNSNTEEPSNLNMPRCPNPCPVSSFMEVIQQWKLKKE
ncbi:prostatic acid phosphatase [Nilaparvata lugens]|uniref:prostatic acid phosphatase n=1 Tax=Nilaparvata lugens TaxID=108931 RepID=UPI00193EB997|nr:prostatic acid phosphatase [Nilaparvata lugens]